MYLFLGCFVSVVVAISPRSSSMLRSVKSPAHATFPSFRSAHDVSDAPASVRSSAPGIFRGPQRSQSAQASLARQVKTASRQWTYHTSILDAAAVADHGTAGHCALDL